MATISIDSVQVFGDGVYQGEGLVVDRENNVYSGGRNGVMYKVSPQGRLSELATIDGGLLNGIVIDKAGDLIVCDLGSSALIKVTRSGRVSRFCDQVADVKLTLPNFASYDADWNLYLSNTTSRTIKEVMSELEQPEPLGSLVCIRANGKQEVVARGIYLANGTAIDPTEEAVYVLQSNQNNCLRIAIRKDGTWGKAEVYSENFPGSPDGMAFAADGTLFVTIPGGNKMAGTENAHVSKIIKVDTQGRWTEWLDDPSFAKTDHPTNCAFGGPGLRTLYIANLGKTQMAKVDTEFRGHPLVHQR